MPRTPSEETVGWPTHRHFLHRRHRAWMKIHQEATLAQTEGEYRILHHIFVPVFSLETCSIGAAAWLRAAFRSDAVGRRRNPAWISARLGVALYQGRRH